MSPNRTPRTEQLAALAAADRRLQADLDALSADTAAAVSGLPGWTRGHVVAHLVLNAEALARVLEGAAADEPVPMYPSQARRDGDIEGLARTPAGELALRHRTAASRFTVAAANLSAAAWGRSFDRVPDGPTLPVAAVPLMRWREVEIHHVDLAVDYSPDDWSPELVLAVLDSMRARPWPDPFRVRPADVEETWEYGDPARSAPTVTGRSPNLAWWLTGRGDGAGLSADPDPLPEVPAW